VIVNGELVLANDQMTSARPGVALRGPGYAMARDASVSGDWSNSDSPGEALAQ
jgi:hypothetical protein